VYHHDTKITLNMVYQITLNMVYKITLFMVYQNDTKITLNMLNPCYSIGCNLLWKILAVCKKITKKHSKLVTLPTNLHKHQLHARVDNAVRHSVVSTKCVVQGHRDSRHRGARNHGLDPLRAVHPKFAAIMWSR
jgi:hypothetical protein